MNGSPHLQAGLTLGLDVPPCSAKGPLALENSMLNGVCSQHVRQKNIVAMRARTKWKHAGDSCLLPQWSHCTFCWSHCYVTWSWRGSDSISSHLHVPTMCCWLHASQPHDWAYPPQACSLCTGPTLCRDAHSQVVCMSWPQKRTDVVEHWRQDVVIAQHTKSRCLIACCWYLKILNEENIYWIDQTLAVVTLPITLHSYHLWLILICYFLLILVFVFAFQSLVTFLSHLCIL